MQRLKRYFLFLVVLLLPCCSKNKFDVRKAKELLISMGNLCCGGNTLRNREGVIVYMGDQIFGVKWNDWKVLFKENTTIFSPTEAFDTPRVYNLLTDPHERDNVLFPYTWVAEKALPQMIEHLASFKQYPPITPGTPDPYEPPNAQ